jgi:hypothetical protein
MENGVHALRMISDGGITDFINLFKNTISLSGHQMEITGDQENKNFALMAKISNNKIVFSSSNKYNCHKKY